MLYRVIVQGQRPDTYQPRPKAWVMVQKEIRGLKARHINQLQTIKEATLMRLHGKVGVIGRSTTFGAIDTKGAIAKLLIESGT